MRKYLDYYKSMTKKEKIKFFLYIFIVLSLFASLVYEVEEYFHAPGSDVTDSSVRSKADCLLSIIMIVAVSIAMCIPLILRHNFHLYIPYTLEIMFLIFFYCAVYLGEVKSFYYLVPHWDDYLHSASAIMLAIVGFSVVYLLNKSEIVDLSPFFISLFAFLFAFSIGSFWEIYEYLCDDLFNVNAQKFMTDDGVLLVGHAALADTMKDLMVDFAGAFLTSLIGYIAMKKKAVLSTKYLIHPQSEAPKTITLTTQIRKLTPETIAEIEKERKIKKKKRRQSGSPEEGNKKDIDEHI